MEQDQENIKMAARLAGGAIRRILEKKREKELDKAPDACLIKTPTKGE